jgi:hypothetical protein
MYVYGKVLIIVQDLLPVYKNNWNRQYTRVGATLPFYVLFSFPHSWHMQGFAPGLYISHPCVVYLQDGRVNRLFRNAHNGRVYISSAINVAFVGELRGYTVIFSVSISSCTLYIDTIVEKI